MDFCQISVRTEQNISREREAVRDFAVSLHCGDPIEGSPETPRTTLHHGIEGFRRGPQLGSHCVDSRIQSGYFT